jgi:hypothetical protein
MHEVLTIMLDYTVGYVTTKALLGYPSLEPAADQTVQVGLSATVGLLVNFNFKYHAAMKQ